MAADKTLRDYAHAFSCLRLIDQLLILFCFDAVFSIWNAQFLCNGSILYPCRLPNRALADLQHRGAWIRQPNVLNRGTARRRRQWVYGNVLLSLCVVEGIDEVGGEGGQPDGVSEIESVSIRLCTHTGPAGLPGVHPRLLKTSMSPRSIPQEGVGPRNRAPTQNNQI